MNIDIKRQNIPELSEDNTKEVVRPPRNFKVLLHNDDYTTMDFVVEILMRIFKKSKSEAVAIMLIIHNNQVGVCGIYPFEIAETKVKQVEALAQANLFPLRCTMEAIDD